MLLGIVIGCVIAWYLGKMSFTKVAEAPWFALIYPFQFGMPKFEIVSIVTMCIVMIVVHDRVGRHVPGAGRHNRHAPSTAPPCRAAFAPTASAR